MAQTRFVLWELTKRELRRKYARSYLGIMWSIVYPLLRMALVVFLFSTIFSKGIEKYPAYYFTAYLIFEFYKTATETSLTTLKDNANLLVKTKLDRSLFVLSRVLTAFINYLLGCIPYIFVLLWYRVKPSWTMLLLPINLLFLILFVTGVSYALAIWFVFLRDVKSIHVNVVFVVRFFVAMFYSVSWVSPRIQWFIIHNPPYTYIKIARDLIVYGQIPESFYFVQMVGFGVGFYLLGKLAFRAFENRVVERL